MKSLNSLADIAAFLEAIEKKQRQNQLGDSLDDAISNIEAAICDQGDEALLALTEKFDAVSLETLKVSEDEMAFARAQTSDEVFSALKKAKDNIERFHEKQRPEAWSDSPSEGVEYGWRYTPIDAAGLYVPGGRAIYPSTVLMNALPAKVAGVERLVMVSPPQKNGQLAPVVLAAAELCGITEIYKVGGAQAVFALAYGTESIQKVDKIVGPGNIFVTLAKQRVYGCVDIDKPAGPSEVMVWVEDEAYLEYAAAEVLAQLEHDPLAVAVLVSSNTNIIKKIASVVNEHMKSLKRQTILSESIENFAVLHLETKADIIAAINLVASEHLSLCLDDAKRYLAEIKHAGSIFCGPFTPVTLGDYIAGPNHVLPTTQAARFSGPLNVLDFMKGSSFLSYDREALKQVASAVDTLTELEGLDAHNQAVKIRL